MIEVAVFCAGAMLAIAGLVVAAVRMSRAQGEAELPVECIHRGRCVGGPSCLCHLG